MSDVAESTIAQAVYASSQGCNFARVVAEMEDLLSRLRHRPLRTRWDYEDIVIFDIGSTRVLLAWSDDQTDLHPVCLMVSVGPLPTAIPALTDPSHELLCSRLIERIQNRYPPEAVLWRQLPLAVEADLVDVLFDSLPPLSEAVGMRAPTDTPNPTHRMIRSVEVTGPTPAAATPVTPGMAAPPANDVPDLPQIDHGRLARVRAALYPAPATPPAESPQLRLAAQAMNATLIVVWAPLGAAVMTYSLLKGENMAFSARMMAVTGSMIGLSQLPFVQQVVALAGV